MRAQTVDQRFEPQHTTISVNVCFLFRSTQDDIALDYNSSTNKNRLYHCSYIYLSKIRMKMFCRNIKAIRLKVTGECFHARYHLIIAGSTELDQRRFNRKCFLPLPAAMMNARLVARRLEAGISIVRK